MEYDISNFCGTLYLEVQTNVLLFNPQHKKIYDTVMKTIDYGNGKAVISFSHIQQHCTKNAIWLIHH